MLSTFRPGDAAVTPLDFLHRSRPHAKANRYSRAHWQAQFIEALQQRHNADFPQKIQQLLVDRESLWTPQYRAAYAQTEAAARSLLVDVMAQSSPAQRLKLTQKIDKVRSDFQALKCLKSAQS